MEKRDGMGIDRRTYQFFAANLHYSTDNLPGCAQGIPESQEINGQKF
jgi:hypothetical protein